MQQLFYVVFPSVEYDMNWKFTTIPIILIHRQAPTVSKAAFVMEPLKCHLNYRKVPNAKKIDKISLLILGKFGFFVQIFELLTLTVLAVNSIILDTFFKNVLLEEGKFKHWYSNQSCMKIEFRT